MGAGRRFVRLDAALLVSALPLLAVPGCRDEPTAVRLSEVEAAPLGVEQAVVGSTLNPTFVVRGDGGAVLAGVPVRVEVTEGGGTVRDAATVTTTGATPAGEWTLGPHVGRNTLTITAGALPPVVISVETVPDAPAGVSVAAGGGQFAHAGDQLLDQIVVKVHDRFGNGIAGMPVVLTVQAGGGEIAPSQFTTDAQGLTAGAWWRLGRRGGEQRLLARAGPLTSVISASIRSDYLADVRFFGDGTSDEVRALFAGAAERIHAAVVGDVADVALSSFDVGRCGVPGVRLDEVVDDVVIFASVTQIDGKGRILASAGPCLMRALSGSVVIGVMRFDSDDLPDLLADGRLGEVILHEMLHVVGVGTLWRTRDLVFGSGTTDPRFRGPLATAACIRANGWPQCSGGGVPIENTGGAGTIDVHWRESTFDAELMTGFAERAPGMPMSAVTIFSLEDLGFQVNGFAADPFTLPAPQAVAPRLAPSLAPPWEVLEVPRFEVTPGGWVRPLRWR